jgi:hypothetical protein
MLLRRHRINHSAQTTIPKTSIKPPAAYACRGDIVPCLEGMNACCCSAARAMCNITKPPTTRSAPTKSISNGVFSRGIITSNENKMSDGGRERVSLGLDLWKSSRMWSAQRAAVRSIAWLGADEMPYSARFFLALWTESDHAWPWIGFAASQ